jgi:proteic killer suppression protein
MMIRSIRHKGLRLLYERDQSKGLQQVHVKRIRSILARLDASSAPTDMDLPGLRLHPLTGDRRGYYAVNVSGNWRIVFRFDGRDAVDVDLVDYH